MKNQSLAALSCLLLLCAAPILAAESSVRAGSNDDIPIAKLLEAVAQRTGKIFVVDPRVRAQVELVGMNPLTVGYGELLSILAVHGFAAVEHGNHIQVVPAADVRWMSIPTMKDGQSYFDDEFVSKVVDVKSVPATQLIPALRPLLPQYAHLSAVPCANSVLIVDRYSNVKRLMSVIATMDHGEPYNDPSECLPTDFIKRER